MKPLRERLDDPDATVRAGAVLLGKVPPLELSAEARRRIRARLDAAPESKPLRWLRPAVAIPVLLVVGAAGASIGQRWFSPATPQRAFAPEPLVAPAPKQVSAPPAPQPVQPEPPPTAGDEERERTPRPSASLVPRASQSGPGATLMMEALQARRAGDAARALQLTEEYQHKYPNGALKEESLAIAFESAAARRDPSAPRLAQRYLSTFPKGRFRKQAEQVLANQR